MLTIDGKELRNLEEQVLKNKSDITNLIEINQLLSTIGIEIVGQVSNDTLLPDPSTYTGEYGDAYAVGSATPYDLYIFTRPTADIEYPHWFNIGPFPLPGPQGATGPQGPQGIQGPVGTIWYYGRVNPTVMSTYKTNDYYLNFTDGSVFVFDGTVWNRVGTIRGPQGIQGIQGPQGVQGATGPQGPQGVQGPVGDPFTIVGTLTSTSQLPTPTEETRSQAYLVTIDGINRLYVVVGTDTLMWEDAGTLSGATGPQGPQGPQGEPGTPGTNIINNATGTPLGTVTATSANTGSTLAYRTDTGTMQTSTPAEDNDAANKLYVDEGFADLSSDITEVDGRVAILEGKNVEVILNAPSTATQGTIPQDQYSILIADDSNYIRFNGEIFRLADKQVDLGYLVYTHVGQDNTNNYFTKCITITISTLGWALTVHSVDNNLSITSTNPVRNSTVTSALNGKANTGELVSKANIDASNIDTQSYIDKLGAITTLERYKGFLGGTYISLSNGMFFAYFNISPSGEETTYTFPITLPSSNFTILFTPVQTSTSITATVKLHGRSSQTFSCHGQWQTANGQGATSGDVSFNAFLFGITNA